MVGLHWAAFHPFRLIRGPGDALHQPLAASCLVDDWPSFMPVLVEPLLVLLIGHFYTGVNNNFRVVVIPQVLAQDGALAC